MKRGNPDKIKGQGFHTNPERINKIGRPLKLPQLDELLIEVLGEIKNDKTAIKSICEALKAKAMKGDIRAAELLIDRAYGKLLQKINQNEDVVVVFKRE